MVAYISALISGLQSNTLEKTLGAQAHVTVSSRDYLVLSAKLPEAGETELTQTQPRVQRLRSIANWQALVPVLEAMPEIAGVSPMVSGAGLAVRGEASKSIALLGIDLDRYDKVVRLRSKVVQGVARLLRAKRSSGASWRLTLAFASATGSASSRVRSANHCE